MKIKISFFYNHPQTKTVHYFSFKPRRSTNIETSKLVDFLQINNRLTINLILTFIDLVFILCKIKFLSD